MKNMTRLSCLALFAAGTLFTNNASAQFEMDHLSLGAGIGFTSHAQEIGGSLSFNLRGNYEMDENSSVVVGFNTQLPCTKDFDFFAPALSNMTDPSSTPVTVTQKITFTNISLDYHRYFVKDIEESFGIYGIGGVGLSFAKRTLTASDYDHSLYGFDMGGIPESESFTGFMINLGLGTNININDQFAVFGEAKIAIPAGNEYNSQGNSTITNPLPFNYSILAGVRYNIFD